MRDAGHLHPDIEAFRHAKVRHHIAKLLALDIDRACRAHSLRKRKPIIIDVGDDDVAGADVTRDRRRHDPDRTRPRNQHVLADEIERQGRVCGIAERIEDRRDVV